MESAFTGGTFWGQCSSKTRRDSQSPMRVRKLCMPSTCFLWLHFVLVFITLLLQMHLSAEERFSPSSASTQLGCQVLAMQLFCFFCSMPLQLPQQLWLQCLSCFALHRFSLFAICGLAAWQLRLRLLDCSNRDCFVEASHAGCFGFFGFVWICTKKECNMIQVRQNAPL